MQEINTASWMETDTRWANGEQLYTLPSRHWLRVKPLAHAWRNEHDASWSHYLIDERGQLTTASTWKICHLYPNHPLIAQESLLLHVVFPYTASDDNSKIESDQKPSRIEWQHESVERDGKTLLRWSCEYVQDKFHVAESIWTEPDTHRIVRKEHRETDPRTNNPLCFEVCDQYIYNEEMPEAIFEMPADKPIVTPDTSKVIQEVWDRLSARERHTVQKIINQSNAAWKNSDFPSFAAVWEFNYSSNVPREEVWKERIQQQTGLWNQWNSEVVSANTQKFIPTTISVSAFRMGPDKSKVLRAKVKMSVSWGEGIGWEGTAEYYLRRRFWGYRIVHWEFPWEEIKEARAEASQTSGLSD